MHAIMGYNKLLERQIKKHLTTSGVLDENLMSFIQSVDDSYNAFERDKRLSEHAFQVSEKDYLDIYERLKSEINIRNQSILKLKEAILNMEPDSDMSILPGVDNLLDVVNYLDVQIKKRKAAEASLKIAKEEAEKANQAKSDFLSIMSHEIRTPLSVVIGLGNILFRQNPRPDQLNNLQVLRTSADNLLALINDILDFSKIDASKLELEHTVFDIRKTVDEIYQAISIKAQEKDNLMSIYVDAKIPTWVFGDPHRITQVLNNLLSNAVKFTHNGKVRLSLQLENISDSRCTILFSVTDTGIGIAKDKIQYIFTPFSQSSSSITREFGGTGLGLAITSELLQLMDSQLKLETEIGRGSSFYFSLDLVYVSAVEKVPLNIAPEEQDLQKAKILLVEDTPFNILFTTQLLEGWNTVVDVAENGAIAVDKMKESEFDIVIMDLHMPVMDGYTSTKKIREFNQDTPIIALTASATADIREKIFAVGMQDYVTKPFDSDQLFSQMKRAMKK
jgi:signal transduction histidine kinase/CheY-like chemotaxis protein